jgi:hypothetical protein
MTGTGTSTGARLPSTEEDGATSVTITKAPSHVLPQGTAVHLPQPTRLERRRFVERSILAHKLLQDWTKDAVAEAVAEDGVNGALDDTNAAPGAASSAAPRIHPLALASARLQKEGIDELNRSINLTSLIQTSEYFGLTNIVADAALELAAATSTHNNSSSNTNKPSSSNEGSAGDTAPPSATGNTASSSGAPSKNTPPPPVVAATPEQAMELQQSANTQASYVLKRKHAQFAQAAALLGGHKHRLTGGLQADQRPLRRLAQLRHRWRLVAPEHGQRARAHAVRPTEVLAADVDLSSVGAVGAAAAVGRLARRIPRYATIELRPQADAAQKTASKGTSMTYDKTADSKDDPTGQEVVSMQVDNKDQDNTAINQADKEPRLTNDDDDQFWTFAEPFALADPTLGKLDADFDPSKIEMLTLQFSLEETATGRTVSACLEPTRAIEAAQADEHVLMALQHSLFCAKLFESMRRELADDTDEVGQVRTTSQQKYQQVVWLAATSAVAAQAQQAAGQNSRRSLQVVHVHEGEVCVQLDATYTLRVQLVPATNDRETNQSEESAELLLLCKTLLWKAHTLYHEHFVQDALEAEDAIPAEMKSTAPHVQTKPLVATKEPPHILQGCVHLGTKILMERRLRDCFADLQSWLQGHLQAHPLRIQSLSLPVLSAAAHWTLSYGNSWQADVSLEGGPCISVTWWHEEDFRKVDFETDGPFYLFCQRQIQRVIHQQQRHESTIATNGHTGGSK